MNNFKIAFFTLMLLLVTIAANAETRYRAYCEMIYSAITQQTIIIIEGESRNIKDKNGLRRQSDSRIRERVLQDITIQTTYNKQICQQKQNDTNDYRKRF